jgi:hypothetical protein
MLYNAVSGSHEEDAVKKDIQPSTNLAQSMRDIGYTFETALADIIDNAVAAKASSVSIIAPPICPLIIGVVDDGQGMGINEIVDALVLATKPPSSARSHSDLGRFGMGMKTASWSQCKKMTLVSMCSGVLAAASIDLDVIEEEGKWVAEIIDEDAILKVPLCSRLEKDGTLLVWEKIDRVESESEEKTKQHLRSLLDAAREHLQLVFHRFLSYEAGYNTMTIDINGLPLEALDPFFRNHPATQTGPVDPIKIPGKGQVRIQAFTLPHHNKVSAKEWEQMGRSEGHLKNQGFYLYRERRLILWGTWFRLRRLQELLKLSRVKIDIPNTMDEDWQINIMKSSANPPRVIHDRLRNLIDHLGAPSKRVYTFKGASLVGDKPYLVWNQLKAQGNISYRIEPTHPVISNFESSLSDAQKRQFSHVLEFIAAALPVDTLYSDFGSNPESINVHAMPEDDIEFALLEILPSLRPIYDSDDEVLAVLREIEPYRTNFECVERLMEVKAETDE